WCLIPRNAKRRKRILSCVISRSYFTTNVLTSILATDQLSSQSGSGALVCFNLPPNNSVRLRLSCLTSRVIRYRDVHPGIPSYWQRPGRFVADAPVFGSYVRG